MREITERLFKKSGRRAIALMLSLLIAASMLPMMWNTVNADDITCRQNLQQMLIFTQRNVLL